MYPTSIHMAYERVLNGKQSISVFGGYNEFPININPDITNTSLTYTKKKTGYSIGAEYRFYLSSENKYKAPRGVYLAAYTSYFNFNSDRTLVHKDSSGAQSANLNMKITLLNIGGELGYQFVIGKRFIIDAEIFGPSFTYYTFQAKLDGQINGINENETLQAIIEALKEKLPLLNNLSEGKQVNSSGTSSQRFLALGFKYSINIGFKF
ncbi:MAG TPA: DUF3575 domain-containing protein [Puia sp.]|nr:DUF3575 domain-containing protein [Puia sp.]